MPRVAINAKQYRQKDFKDMVRIKMRDRKISQVSLAKDMGITQAALSAKLSTGKFTHEDMLTIIKRLGFEDGEILKVMKI